MKLKLINVKTIQSDNNLLDIDLELTNKNYNFSFISQYSEVSKIFEQGVSNISFGSKVAKLVNTGTKIKQSLYAFFDSLSKINYGDVGLMTSKYYEGSDFSPLTFDFVIENQSINFENIDAKMTAEKEFEEKFSKLLYFSLFKKTDRTGKKSDKQILTDYYDYNVNELLNGIGITTFFERYLKAEFGKTGLVGSATDFKSDIQKINYKHSQGDDKEKTDEFKIANVLDSISNLSINDIYELEYYTPESVMIQLFEEIDGQKYYFLNSMSPSLYDNIKDPEKTANAEDFMSLLKQKGAFIFNIINITFDYEKTNFVKHTNGNYYPTKITGKLTLKNSRGLTLNETERFFTNYYNINTNTN